MTSQWLEPQVKIEVTTETRNAFNLARADRAEETAKEWAAKGDEVQAARWMKTAEDLRRGR